MNLDLAMKRAGPIYERALAQAVDHAVPVEEAALVMTIFAIGSLIGAAGPEGAARHMSEITENLLRLASGPSGSTIERRGIDE